MASLPVRNTEFKSSLLDQFLLETAGKPLSLIHPRRSNRNVTMWSGAVVVSVNDKLPYIFKVMADENFSCVPVVTTSGRFWGFVQVLDLVAYVASLFSSVDDPSKEQLSDLFSKEDRFREMTARRLLEILYPQVTRDHWLSMSVPRTMSFLACYELMVRRNLKHVAVVDDSLQVTSIVTQSMLLGWCYNNIDTTLASVKDITVMQLPRTSQVLTIRDNQPAITAFRQLASERVGGLVVVNETGEMVTVISAKDLKGINPTADDFLKLWRPITLFKSEVRKRYPAHTPIYSDVYCLVSDTLKTAIVMMDEDRVKRLPVVRGTLDKRPAAIITQTDVLLYLFNLACPSFQDSATIPPTTPAVPMQTQPTPVTTATISK